MDTYIVYVLIDENSNIIAVNSSAFLTDIASFIQIDSGTTDKYHHAQNNYFEKPIMTDSGIWRYKLINGEVVEKTAEMIELEESELPLPPMSQDDKILQLQQGIAELTMYIATISGG
jgi:hypothetical protein